MTIDILAQEELPEFRSSLLQDSMRDTMPWLANQFVLAARKVPNLSNILPMSRGETEWQLQHHIMPVLLEQIKETYEDDEPLFPGQEIKYPESPITRNLHYALALNLGLLAPAIAHARLALYELLDSEFISIRTAAALAIMYTGHMPRKVDQEGLMQAIETNMLFKIPLQMYIKILPNLKPIFRRNTQLTQSLLERFRAHRSSWGLFNYIETALFLASIDVVDEEVLDELMDWSEFFDFGPYHAQYCERCRQMVARLMESNQSALGYVTEKIIDEAGTTPVAEAEAWFKILLEIDPQKALRETLPKLFDIAKEMAMYPEYHVSVIRAVVKFANVGSQQAEAKQWILTRLKSDDTEVVYRTLRGIWELTDIDDAIQQQVLNLAQAESGEFMDVQAPAVETIGKWGLTDNKALAIVEKATRSEDFLVARKGRDALEKLKPIRAKQ